MNKVHINVNRASLRRAPEWEEGVSSIEEVVASPKNVVCSPDAVEEVVASPTAVVSSPDAVVSSPVFCPGYEKPFSLSRISMYWAKPKVMLS